MTTTPTVPVDPSNAGAFEAWNGADGAYWVANEAVFDDSLARYERPFFDAAGIAPHHRVLDLGCGNGQTTRAAARIAIGGEALGVDVSAPMLDRARQRAAEEGLSNVRFLQADAQIHPFDDAAFDIAISRTGAMFFGDPVAAFANIGRALRPGGRLVLLTWQELTRNHWVRDFSVALAAGRDLPSPPPGAPGPFSLADPDRVQTILTAAGLADVRLEGVEEPMWFGPTAQDALRFVLGLGFTEFMLRELHDAARTGAIDELRASIEAHETSDGVLYPSATWIVTAHRA